MGIRSMEKRDQIMNIIPIQQRELVRVPAETYTLSQLTMPDIYIYFHFYIFLMNILQ